MKPRVPAPPVAVEETVTPLPAPEAFADRHIGPRPEDLPAMLETLGYDDLDKLIEAVIPESIRIERPLDLSPPATEAEADIASLGLVDHVPFSLSSLTEAAVAQSTG